MVITVFKTNLLDCKVSHKQCFIAMVPVQIDSFITSALFHGFWVSWETGGCNQGIRCPGSKWGTWLWKAISKTHGLSWRPQDCLMFSSFLDFPARILNETSSCQSSVEVHAFARTDMLILSISEDCRLPGSSVHRICQERNTGVCCHFQLQGIFLVQGLNLHLCVSCIGRLFLYHLHKLGSLLGLWRSLNKRIQIDIDMSYIYMIK